MIQIQENINLKQFNTFGLDVSSRYFCKISSDEAIQELLTNKVYQNESRFILGGGSNVLFINNYGGLIIKSELKGIDVIEETDENVILEVKSGEVWHNLVMYCVSRKYGGIENLSLIPGTVGAAPIQNIGAYGVEVKDVIKKVEGIDLSTGKKITFDNVKCEFSYRDSIFKHQLKEKFFISSVTLSLTKKNHLLNINYGAIKDTLSEMKVEPTIQSISDAVIKIRRSKLPDPTTLGNAGSFFKNPTITLQHYQSLKKEFKEIPGYTIDNQYIKVPAAWLIEACGWKGKRIKNIGVHSQQALVIVNYGNGKGEEIFQLAMEIISSVKKKFDITLTPEVNIIS
jgi:UDP-N-acetylmuramate dehydrogenase